jgi:hypothetical protein
MLSTVNLLVKRKYKILVLNLLFIIIIILLSYYYLFIIIIYLLLLFIIIYLLFIKFIKHIRPVFQMTLSKQCGLFRYGRKLRS